MTARITITCDVCGESWDAGNLPVGWQSFAVGGGKVTVPARFRCGAVDLCPGCQSRGVAWSPANRDFVQREGENGD